MDILKYIIISVAGYLLGSVSTAILLSIYRFKHDVRKEGSGNAGATNVARVFGLNAGLVTLFGDMLKTFLSGGLGWLLMGNTGLAVGCAAALIGHCWPVYFNFKGGKGVSVAACIALLLDWRMFLILLCIFIIIFLITRTVSICSVISALIFPLAYYLLNSACNAQFWVCVIVAVMVTFLHRDNIRRIFRGEEKKFVLKSKNQEDKK